MNFEINHPINLFSLIGSLLDFWGVILLFYYGLPSPIQHTQTFLVANDVENKSEVEERNKMIKKKAKKGITLIVIGFAFQIVSVFFHLGIYRFIE